MCYKRVINRTVFCEFMNLLNLILYKREKNSLDKRIQMSKEMTKV